MIKINLKRKLFLFIYILVNYSIFYESIDIASHAEKNVPNITPNYEKNHEYINWEKLSIEEYNDKGINWEILSKNENSNFENESIKNNLILKEKDTYTLSSLNRSVVFGEKIAGPDISWLVPPGFKWTKNYKIDASIRGYNQTLNHTRKPNEGWGWNSGDAVGQFYYQFLNTEKYSFGSNIGIRSVLSGAAGSNSPLGEGLSAGFRIDHKLSNNSGIAFGAEQLFHFDDTTDTGRDIYLTVSKGFWDSDIEGNFPLKIATGGIATGRLAEGNIRGLCSDLFGGAGTEFRSQRRLCWAPVFSLAYLFNEKFSSFFEYNSRHFLIGSSIAPFKKIALRGTFALSISDHIDNYKVNSLDETTWTFRLSLGF